MSYTIRPFRSGGWEYDIVLHFPDQPRPYRERKKAPGETKTEAKEWARLRERHLLKHGPPQKRSKAASEPKEEEKQIPTLAEFVPQYIEYCRANRQKPNTVYSKERLFRGRLIPAFGDRRLDQFTPQDEVDIKAAMAHLSPKTVNNVLALLNATLTAAKELRVIAERPIACKWMKTSDPKMEFYDFDVYDNLRAAARHVDPRAGLVLLLGGDAGLRCGEIRALRWESIDFDRRLITVERAYSHGVIVIPKSNRIRTVPMTMRLVEALREHRREQGEDADASGNVLLNDLSEPPKGTTIRTWLGWVQTEAGLPVKGPHTLRHTFCSHLAMRGAHIMEIKALAGHADIETTQRYMHLSPRALRDAVNLLEEPSDRRLGDRVETKKGPGKDPL